MLPDAAETTADGPDAPDPEEVAVECANLVVRYGSVTAVAGLSFRARWGEVLALLGPNGAGKTSTIESLEGYRRPASGRVRVMGLDPVTEHRSLVGCVGVMLQRDGVYPMLGPRRVLELFGHYYPDAEDPDALLDLVSLRAVARTPWRHLSGGEQRRLSLALALVGRPRVVFLDEPTAGVDPEGRLAIRDVVSELTERRICVLLTTHELAEAEKMAHRVLIVQHGRSVAEGTPAELAASAGDATATVSFGARAGLDTIALAGVLGVEVVEERPGRYRVAAGATPQMTAALAGWLADRDATLTDLRAGRSLEEAYLSVVGDTGPVGTGGSPRTGGTRETGDAAGSAGNGAPA